MPNENLPMPDFIDIDPEAQAAAAAAMSFGKTLTPPPDAVVSSSDGKLYKRWTEAAVIEDAWKEPANNGCVVAVVQAKIRSGYPNEHNRVWARHLLHFGAMAGQEVPNKDYKSMNYRSINAITTLIQATGFKADAGGISGKMLNFLFPPKNQPGVKSPLVGKAVMLNLSESPNNGKNAKTERQTGVDTYLPDVDGVE